MKSKLVYLEYPRVEENEDTIRVELIDVRAADGIIIQYDFERDGWVISQKKLIEHDGCWSEPTGELVEMAFIQAWENTVEQSS